MKKFIKLNILQAEYWLRAQTEKKKLVATMRKMMMLSYNKTMTSLNRLFLWSFTCAYVFLLLLLWKSSYFVCQTIRSFQSIEHCLFIWLFVVSFVFAYIHPSRENTSSRLLPSSILFCFVFAIFTQSLWPFCLKSILKWHLYWSRVKREKRLMEEERKKKQDVINHIYTSRSCISLKHKWDKEKEKRTEIERDDGSGHPKETYNLQMCTVPVYHYVVMLME